MLSTYQRTHGVCVCVCYSGLNTPHTHINNIKRWIYTTGDFNHFKHWTFCTFREHPEIIHASMGTLAKCSLILLAGNILSQCLKLNTSESLL